MGANFLANVAAVEKFGFFDDLGKFWGDFAFVFNGEVGDAEAGVDDTGCDDGAGRAGLDAFRAAAAGVEAVGLGIVPGGWGFDY